MKKNISLVIIVLSLCASGAAQVTAQWRGPARDGIYFEKNLLKTWPAEGPALTWKTESVGNGYGSPAVTANRIYICGEIDSTGYLFAFDHQGNLVWKSDYGKEWVVSYAGSRGTPTVAGNLVYVCSGLGILTCFDATTGSRKWSVNMVNDLHGRFTLYGHAESPLVEKGTIFLVPGGTDTNVVAMDRFTGKILWVCKGAGDIPGYNSPLLIRLAARDILVTFSAYHLMGIDARTGELLWTHEQDNTPMADRKPGMGDTHSNTVLYENRFIYYIAGDGNCAVKLALSDDGGKITQVWRNRSVDNYMGGFVKLGNSLFSGVTEKKQLVRLDAGTGLVTDSLKCGTGTLIWADSLLYYYNQRGEVKLVRPNPGKMEIVGSLKITAGTKEHFSHPVIYNGMLYIRHGKALMAYDIRTK